MSTYIVRVARMETIDFLVEADDEEDAQARYLMDGDEVSSSTERLEILDVSERHYVPKHRANEPMVMIPQREHVDVLESRAAGTSAVEITRTAFRRMVTAFEGGYHPDIDPTDYIGWPFHYPAERVEEIEDIARALGLDLYAEALAVTQEAMSP